MAQTNRDLRPDVRIGLTLNSTPEIATDTTICLMGFVNDITELAAGVEINTPIQLGSVSSVQQAAAKLKQLGVKFKFASLDTLDLTETDEIAAMLFQSTFTVASWRAYQPENTLRTPKYVLCILDPLTNTRDSNPFGEFFTVVEDDEIPLTTIVPSYIYEAGDSDVSGNYLAEIRAFVETTLEKAKPNLGFVYPIFHLNTPRFSDFDALGYANILRSSTFNTFQDQTSVNKYQITPAMMASVSGAVIACLPANCRGLVYQTIPSFPAPATNEGLFSSDDIQNMLQNGISPIVYNKDAKQQQFSRVVTSTLVDPDLGVARANMLDMQDWKAAYEAQVQIYNAILFNKNIINEKAKLTPSGDVAPVKETVDTVVRVLVRLRDQGLILEPAEGFKSSVQGSLNPDNINQILLTVPIYPTPLIMQVVGEVVAEDPAVIYTQFAITTVQGE